MLNESVAGIDVGREEKHNLIPLTSSVLILTVCFTGYKEIDTNSGLMPNLISYRKLSQTGKAYCLHYFYKKNIFILI